jgi:hypothetical protein
MIDGEPVIVRLSSHEADDESTAGVASIVGELHRVPARYEGHEFSIGSPYPDRNPEHLAGGVLFIREKTFGSATLSTLRRQRLLQHLHQDAVPGDPRERRRLDLPVNP